MTDEMMSLREMIGFASQRLMELEVDALASAPCGKKHPERLGQRNGYRERDWQTRGERSSCAVAATSRASWSRDGWPRRC